VQDPQSLARIVLETHDRDLRNETSTRILDPAALERVVSATADDDLRRELAARIRDPAALERIVAQTRDDVLRRRAVNRLDDPATLFQLAQSTPHAAVQLRAASVVSDRDQLQWLSSSGTNKKVRKAAQRRLQTFHNAYLSVSIRVRCHFCSESVPVNGPLRELGCPGCQRTLKASDRFWQQVLQSPESSRRGRGGFSGFKEATVRCSRQSPVCPHCGAGLALDEVATGYDGGVPCPSCHRPLPTFPTPEWLGRAMGKEASTPEQIFCALREGTEAEPAGRADAPTTIRCESCGADLSLPAEVTPTVKCEYCGSSQLLPEALWNPAREDHVAKVWYVRLPPRNA
jgi:DNA-directed RNA polymerase subunit RPC12/RpoP